jgi:hypothetical protein
MGAWRKTWSARPTEASAPGARPACVLLLPVSREGLVALRLLGISNLFELSGFGGYRGRRRHIGMAHANWKVKDNILPSSGLGLASSAAMPVLFAGQPCCRLLVRARGRPSQYRTAAGNRWCWPLYARRPHPA